MEVNLRGLDKMNFQKINVFFRSSLRYRPWGILVGVSVSYPTRVDAQLLGESRAYVYEHADQQVAILFCLHMDQIKSCGMLF